MTTQITLIKQLTPVASQALTLTINSQEDMTQATSLLSQLNKFNDRITELKDEVLKPLLEATKAERARWKPSELQNEQAIAHIRSQMTIYQTILINTRKAEELAITARIAPGRGNLSLGKAVEKIESLEVVEKTTSTDDGSVQFREKKALKVTDITKIPHEYFDLNEQRLLEALKAGTPTPGAEIEIVLIPYNLR